MALALPNTFTGLLMHLPCPVDILANLLAYFLFTKDCTAASVNTGSSISPQMLREYYLVALSFYRLSIGSLFAPVFSASLCDPLWFVLQVAYCVLFATGCVTLLCATEKRFQPRALVLPPSDPSAEGRNDSGPL